MDNFINRLIGYAKNRAHARPRMVAAEDENRVEGEQADFH